MVHIPRRIPLILICLALLGLLAFISSSPKKTDDEVIVTIPEGAALNEVSAVLHDAGVVRSPSLLRVYLIVTGRETAVEAGLYAFSAPESVYEVARRIWQGEHGIDTIKITIPEGFTADQIADRVLEAFPSLVASTTSPTQSASEVRRAFAMYEGYLYPETYFFFASSTVSDIITRMTTEFDRVMQTFTFTSPQARAEAVVLASILEAEAQTLEDKQIIAGILYNRIEAGMPLQVDATLKYITGRGSAELTVNDLRLNSPYNSYMMLGLPPGPIGNAGYDSLFAALNPIKTDYYYFLTGNDGLMYYAEDLDGHKVNRAKYLD